MRYIPETDTHALALLSFDEALEMANQPNEAYDIRKWLYVPPAYLPYRYLLGTRCQRPLIVIGLNPSTATPMALDRTLQSAERIAHHNGFDGFMMFNLYAQRATMPKDMEASCNERLCTENLKAFAYLLENIPNPQIWAAWGAIITTRPYLSHHMHEIGQLAQAHQATWWKAGPLTRAGHPHHPLYLKKTTVLEPFDFESYLSKLESIKKTHDQADGA